MADVQTVKLKQIARNASDADPSTIDQEGEFNILSLLGQTALGAANEALLGLPQWILDREKEGLFKEEDTKAERFARGVGSFLGFFALPGAIAAKGAKLGAKAAIGAGKATRASQKTLRLLKAAGSGAGGFAGFEASRLPLATLKGKDELEKTLEEIPMAMALGAGLGVTGKLLSPIVKKHAAKLKDNLLKKGSSEEYQTIMKAVAGESAKVARKADAAFHSALKSEEFIKAKNIASNIYSGTKQKIRQKQLDIAHTEWVAKNPKLREMLVRGDISDKVKANTAKLLTEAPGKARDFWTATKKVANDVRFNKFTTGSDVYGARQGEAGNTIIKLINRVRSSTEKLAGQSNGTYKIVTDNLTDDAKFKVVDALEGRIFATGSSKTGNAVQNIKNEFTKISNLAKKLQVQTRDASGELRTFMDRENFFPHFLILPGEEKHVVKQVLDSAVKRGDFKTKQSANKALKSFWDYVETQNESKGKRIIQWLARKNNITEDKAKTLLNGFVERTNNPKFGNIEHSRGLNLPFFDPHPDRVIPRYISGAYQRLNEVRVWGQDNKVYNALQEKVRREGFDHQFFNEMQKRLSGATAQQYAFGAISPSASEKLRTIQVITKLGLSTIGNATQSNNTAMVTGTRNTARQIKNLFSSPSVRKEMDKFALDIGATMESTLNDFMSGAGMSGSINIGGVPVSAQKFLRKTGFIGVEKFNRVISANAGKDYMVRTAKKLINNPNDKLSKRKLKELGVDINKLLKRKRLTWNEIVKGSQDIVNKSQFRTGPQDLPLWFSSPEGKILTQFKSFSFNQAKLIKNLLRDEVSKGNFAPLITAVTVMPILGEGVKDVRGILSGQVRDEKGMERLLENISSVGGIGMLNDIVQSVKYNNVSGFLAGPTFSDLGTLTSGVVRATQGKPRTLQRQALRSVPVVGSKLQNTFVPSRRLQRARKRREKEKKGK